MNYAARTGHERIPTLPATVCHLLRIYGREEYKTADIVEVLEHDPAISGRLLRLANSPYFCFASEVRSLGAAVFLLGNATVQGLAVGSCLMRPWINSTAPEAVRKIWSHSFLAATGARKLAALLPGRASSEPDALFTATLLHDIGKILLLARRPEKYSLLLEAGLSRVDMAAEERALFGETHGEAGFEALLSWKMGGVAAGLAIACESSDLREEMRGDYELFSEAHSAATGGDGPLSGSTLDASSLEEMRRTIAENLGAAEDFYRALIH